MIIACRTYFQAEALKQQQERPSLQLQQ
jgi:hypothetical protein